MQSSMRCGHSFDGINLICPFGCHGVLSKPTDEITHLVRPKKAWFIGKHGAQTIDMVGKTIGQLTVKAHTSGSFFICTCSCGEETVRAGKDLRNALRQGMDSCCKSCLTKKKMKSK